MPAPRQCAYGLLPPFAATAARMVNDGVAAYVARRPDRFVGCGTVPLPDGEAAALEVERCVRRLGFVGVQVLTSVAGCELSDPGFAAFWEAAERCGALVVIHPAGFAGTTRLSRFYFDNIIGNPLDTAIALHYLIFDGVLERHPGLKILAVHGGGYYPGYVGRADHAWGARSDAHAALPQPPSAYLRRIHFDSVMFAVHQLEQLVTLVGGERVLMGTDYPYDMGEYEPVSYVRAARFSTNTQRAIQGANAVQLLGLEWPRSGRVE